MTTQKLTADRVREILMDSLFRDEEISNGVPPDGAVIVDGVMSRFALHPDRLNSHRSEISEMLSELPDEFHASKGGGWSFLNACMDRHGNHWAEQPTVGDLMVLGLATGDVKVLVPRDMWPMMPGGLPYFSVAA